MYIVGIDIAKRFHEAAIIDRAGNVVVKRIHLETIQCVMRNYFGCHHYALLIAKRSENKDHLTAIGHVCHKILAKIFAVLHDNKPYIPASLS